MLIVIYTISRLHTRWPEQLHENLPAKLTTLPTCRSKLGEEDSTNKVIICLTQLMYKARQRAQCDAEKVDGLELHMTVRSQAQNSCERATIMEVWGKAGPDLLQKCGTDGDGQPRLRSTGRF